jgi:hypothetical protein
VTLYTERRARKAHRCTRCRTWIQPGETYVRAALPPRSDPFNSDHWWTDVAHGRYPADCPVDAWGQPREAS